MDDKTERRLFIPPTPKEMNGYIGWENVDEDDWDYEPNTEVETEQTWPSQGLPPVQSDGIYMVVSRYRLKVPYVCPVCCGRTNNQMNLYFDANSSSVRSKGRKIYFSSSQGMISFPFYCCHSEEELRKYVFFKTKGEDNIFYFKSKDYAELFAKINNLECQKVSNGTFEEQQMISKAKNAGEGNLLLVVIRYFLYGVGALLIVFSILALFSS